MGILNRKKEFDYFGNFCEVGEIASQAADYLYGALLSFDKESIGTYTEIMHQYENDADLKKHILCRSLAHEFMPPIEREDISQLSQELDNIVDAVEDVIRKIYIFNIESIRDQAVEFTKLIADACKLFDKLLKEFSNFKKSKEIHHYVVEINTIENAGDKLHAESVRRLFLEDITPSEQLAWTMIFESLEISIDACENAADLIESIIIKNT